MRSSRFLALLALGLALASPAMAEIQVFAAASLTEAMEEIAAAYEKTGGGEVMLNLGSSSNLARQIQEGAPADLFLSADEARMDGLASRGLVLGGTRRSLLSNTLVIVAGSRSTARMDGPCALATLPFRHLAMGDPEAVPAGIYAKRWMQGVRCGGRPLWDAVRGRVAPTPDVRAAIGLVAADPDVAGLVYRTDQLAFADRTRVLYEVKEGPPIRYAVAMVAEGTNAEGARAFLDFVAGADAAQVFAARGFIPMAGQTAAAP